MIPLAQWYGTFIWSESCANAAAGKIMNARIAANLAPGDSSLKPQQYVVDEKGNWTINCLACHQGKVAGKVVPGVPNSCIASAIISTASPKAPPGGRLNETVTEGNWPE